MPTAGRQGNQTEGHVQGSPSICARSTPQLEVANSLPERGLLLSYWAAPTCCLAFSMGGCMFNAPARDNSYACASCRRLASSKARPTICSPTGMWGPLGLDSCRQGRQQEQGGLPGSTSITPNHLTQPHGPQGCPGATHPLPPHPSAPLAWTQPIPNRAAHLRRKSAGQHHCRQPRQVHVHGAQVALVHGERVGGFFAHTVRNARGGGAQQAVKRLQRRAQLVRDDGAHLCEGVGQPVPPVPNGCESFASSVRGGAQEACKAPSAAAAHCLVGSSVRALGGAQVACMSESHEHLPPQA